MFYFAPFDVYRRVGLRERRRSFGGSRPRAMARRAALDNWQSYRSQGWNAGDRDFTQRSRSAPAICGWTVVGQVRALPAGTDLQQGLSGQGPRHPRGRPARPWNRPRRVLDDVGERLAPRSLDRGRATDAGTAAGPLRARRTLRLPLPAARHRWTADCLLVPRSVRT
jgi:hypothetical protein